MSAKQACNTSYKLHYSPAHLRPCVCKLRARGKLVYCSSRRYDSEVETARSAADTVSQHVQAPTQVSHL